MGEQTYLVEYLVEQSRVSIVRVASLRGIEQPEEVASRSGDDRLSLHNGELRDVPSADSDRGWLAVRLDHGPETRDSRARTPTRRVESDGALT